MLVEFGGIWLSWWNLVEFNWLGRIWQNLIKALEFICRVFHQDIPTVTGLVPLHLDNIIIYLNSKESYYKHVKWVLE